ncbi:uncharacterized protein LOC100181197 [Ciona intestinalis]
MNWYLVFGWVLCICEAKNLIVSCIDETTIVDDVKNQTRNLCIAKDIRSFQEYWSNENETPAVAPTFLENVSMKIINDNIELTLTWEQRVKDFLYTTGYLLEASSCCYDGPSILTYFDASAVKLTVRHYSLNESITFHHDFTRTNLIQLGDIFTFTLVAMPTYKKKTEKVCDIITVKIADTFGNDNLVAVHEECSLDDDDFDTDDVDYPSYDSNTEEPSTFAIYQSLIVVSVTASIITLGFLVGMMYVRHTGILPSFLRRKEKVSAMQTLFLLSSMETNQLYKEVSNVLVSIFNKNDTKFNLRCSTSMGCEYSWFKEQVNQCQHIVLICTPCCSEYSSSQKLDSFYAGVEYVVKQGKFHPAYHDKQVSVVYFNQESKFYFPELLNVYKVKWFNLALEIQSFIHHVSPTAAASSKVENNIQQILRRISHETLVNMPGLALESSTENSPADILQTEEESLL